MTQETKNANVILIFVPVDQVEHYWPIAKPLIALAQERYEGQYSIEDVLAALRNGVATLWLIMVDETLMAAMTTSYEIYPKKQSLVIELIGGKSPEVWADEALRQLAVIGKNAGYHAIETKARAGWLKMAKQHGFKIKHVAYEMEL